MKTKIAISAVILAVLAGCESKPGPVVTHPVSGRVLYNGKPAAGVQVYFYPTSAPMVPQIPSNPHGVTGPDGSFKLSTFGKDDGAAEGGYQVVLLWPPEKTTKEGESEGEASDSDRLLGWYTAVNSTLSAQIKSGNNELMTFNLPAKSVPPNASEGVPGRN